MNRCVEVIDVNKVLEKTYLCMIKNVFVLLQIRFLFENIIVSVKPSNYKKGLEKNNNYLYNQNEILII